MNGSDNSWVILLVGGGFLLYWLAQSNATSAANTSQTGIPPGSKVAGSTVYNAQGQVIGTVTSAGYYYPTIGSSGVPATSNPLTGATVINYQAQIQVPAWTGGISQTPVTCPTGKHLVDVGDLMPAFTCQ